MKRQKAQAFPRAAIRFENAFLDFQKGIQVGHLDDNQRITRILKLALEERYNEEFVTERFGRGVYWRWIGFVSRSNRACKPLSSKISFGCAKFFLTITGIDGWGSGDPLFKCGFSVERGMAVPPPQFPQVQLRDDWDWYRLLEKLETGSLLEKELKRLVVKEGFAIEAGNWDTPNVVKGNKFPGAPALRRSLLAAPPDAWAGLQVYYAMTEAEIRATTGVDLVEAMLAIFRETTPAMNQCMQIDLNLS